MLLHSAVFADSQHRVCVCVYTPRAPQQYEKMGEDLVCTAFGFKFDSYLALSLSLSINIAPQDAGYNSIFGSHRTWTAFEDAHAIIESIDHLSIWAAAR